jgi:hypothetical protein
MDPISLTVTVAGLAKSLFTCATSVYDFIDKAGVVDITVRSLHAELQTLKQMVYSIDQALNTAHLRKDDVIPL